MKTALQRAVATVPAEREGVGNTDPLRSWMAFLHPKVDSEPFSQIVMELKAQPELALFDGKMQVLANNASRVDYEGLASWLVFRALQAGVERALDDLRRYVTESEFECYYIKALGGIEVEGLVPLGNDITLVPFSSVADGFQKRLCEYESLGPGSTPRPSAALVQTLIHPRIHINPDETIPNSLTKMASSNHLEDARLCLTLVGPSGPAGFGSWFMAAEWVPCMFGSCSMYAPAVELRGGRRRLENSEYERAREIHELFLHLDSDSQARLRVPLQRLNLAIRRYSIVDSAIDLRIAMEAAFLDDLKNDGELSYRLRIRAARLLETDEQKRRDLYATFGDIYELCSKAVHTGKVLGNKGRDVNVLLQEGILRTSKAIELAIRRGGIDWTSVTLS